MKKRTTCIAIAVVAILAILLLNNPSEMMGQYINAEEYLLLQAENKKTEMLTAWEIPFVVMADEPVEVAVIDRKLEYLEHYEELDEYTADGTLETWGYNWLIKIDASETPQSSVVLSARGMDEDGYFSQTTGQYVLVLHYPDGSYDILGEIPLLEAVDFLAQHNSGEQSIYALLQCELISGQLKKTKGLAIASPFVHSKYFVTISRRSVSRSIRAMMVRALL